MSAVGKTSLGKVSLTASRCVFDSFLLSVPFKMSQFDFPSTVTYMYEQGANMRLDQKELHGLQDQLLIEASQCLCSRHPLLGL